MAGTVDNINPRSLAMSDFDEAVGKLVAHIRRERPDVVVTFDQTGGYGHPDHVAIHYQTKAAFTAAGDPARYPEQIAAGLAPYRPHKLYYTAIPRRFFESIILTLQEMGLADHPRVKAFLESPVGLPPEACTTDIEVHDFWEQKYASRQCHATQLNPDSIFAVLPAEAMRDLQRWECFQLARSDVGPDDGLHDLFAGLR
jgi:LmbE family N-acetylglucosaminyl deacetylase